MVFTFWSLYLYDRDLVYPRLLDNFIPQWLNHGMVSHTACTLILVTVNSWLKNIKIYNRLVLNAFVVFFKNMRRK